MVIWTRWGILGIIIPTALIVVAMIALDPGAERRVQEGKPVEQATAGVEPSRNVEDPKEAQRERAEQREQTEKWVKGTGYLIGGLVSAVVLWPLGCWMNKSHTIVDQQTGEIVETRAGGEHTLFFIPFQYWSFIWVAFGLYEFFDNR